MSQEVTSDEPRCFMRHVRMAGLCSQGSRAWCERNGVDWSAFLGQGIPGEVLIETGDPIVARVVDAARKELRGE